MLIAPFVTIMKTWKQLNVRDRCGLFKQWRIHYQAKNKNDAIAKGKNFERIRQSEISQRWGEDNYWVFASKSSLKGNEADEQKDEMQIYQGGCTTELRLQVGENMWGQRERGHSLKGMLFLSFF